MGNKSMILLVFLILIIVSIAISLFSLYKYECNKESRKASFSFRPEKLLSQRESSQGEISEVDPSGKENNRKYPRTFFIDIDGTIFPNSTIEELEKYSLNNTIQELLPGVKEFFQSLGENDVVVITTGRSERFRRITELNFKEHNIKYKHLIMSLPIGQRFLINDTPNMLYQKAIGINLLRNKGFGDAYNFNPTY